MATSRHPQLDAFPAAPRPPDGFCYWPAALAPGAADELAGAVARLDLQPFAYRSFVGRRRTVSFGWRYDFTGGGLQSAPPLPDCLAPLRERAAALAGVPAALLEQASVIEYAPGAGIGWHRDRPQFGLVLAFSLGAPCRLRLRRRRTAAPGWERHALVPEPGSAYLLSGPARDEWEHGIPPVAALRYSVSFRTMRRRAGR